MTLLLRSFGLTILLLFLPAIGSGNLFAPSADLWERWQMHDARSGTTVDHSAWDDLLDRHLKLDASGANLFDYGGLKGSRADTAALTAYLDQLSATPVSTLNRDEQMAFWINLYNALTVQVVVDNYPVASVRDIDISPGLFASGPWDKELIKIEGEDLSLNDIEHRILRPIWQDPRIHYAVNCASIGCPDLQVDAWRASTLEAMLNAAARTYVNDPRGVSVKGGKVTVSSIYDWFIDDFGGTEATVLAHLKQYADADLTAKLDQVTSIEDAAYDWSLNGAK
ncbi:MAG: DUF547 domain-containing protein [Pseudomonadota bacterium]